MRKQAYDFLEIVLPHPLSCDEELTDDLKLDPQVLFVASSQRESDGKLYALMDISDSLRSVRRSCSLAISSALVNTMFWIVVCLFVVCLFLVVFGCLIYGDLFDLQFENSDDIVCYYELKEERKYHVQKYSLLSFSCSEEGSARRRRNRTADTSLLRIKGLFHFWFYHAIDAPNA